MPSTPGVIPVQTSASWRWTKIQGSAVTDTTPPHHHELGDSLKGEKKELQMENGIFDMLECLGRRMKVDSGKGREKKGRELGMAPCLIPMLLHSTLR